MEEEWQVEVEARATIVTHTRLGLAGEIRVVSQHSHIITPPFMPSPCANTTQQFASIPAANVPYLRVQLLVYELYVEGGGRSRANHCLLESLQGYVWW